MRMSHKMLSQGVSVHGGNSQVSFSIIILLFTHDISVFHFLLARFFNDRPAIVSTVRQVGFETARLFL